MRVVALLIGVSVGWLLGLGVSVPGALAYGSGPMLTVSTTSDIAGSSCSSTCSLREAVNQADGVTGEPINIPAGIYVLDPANGPLEITSSMALDGGNPQDTVITTGSGASGGIRILDVSAPAVFGGGFTLQGGSTSSGGGAVLVSSGASLTLDTVVFADNSAASGGGAIEDHGTLTLYDSQFKNNTTAGSGGAIEIQGAGGPTATITGSTFSGNSASANGGAIVTAGAGGNSVRVDHSSFSGNNAAGRGGAIEDEASSTAATLTVTDSTIYKDQAGMFGGGLSLGNGTDTESFTNDTIDSNAVTGSTAGGGGGDIGVGTGPKPTLVNTIIAAGSAANGADCLGTVISVGHNLEDANGCGLTGPGDLVNTAPHLGAPLTGTTVILPLLPGSPAIDAGTNTGCPMTDQRGAGRPLGASCDIGAYEWAPPIVGNESVIRVTATTAALQAAAINPAPTAGTARFQYGTGIAYGRTTAPQSLPHAGLGRQPIFILRSTLTGLRANTTYHFREVATNPDGTVYGTDRTFTTSAANHFALGPIHVSSTGILTTRIRASSAARLTAQATFEVRRTVKIRAHGKVVLKQIHTTETYGTARLRTVGRIPAELAIPQTSKASRELATISRVKITITVTFHPTRGPERIQRTTVTITRSRHGRYR
jgi:CSLREA domain-containing protein